MTSPLRIEPQTNLEAAALAVPGAYESEVRLARVIAEYIAAMPLSTMAVRAGDERGMELLRNRSIADGGKTYGKMYDHEIVELLASTQRQLAKIRARYGE